MTEKEKNKLLISLRDDVARIKKVRVQVENKRQVLNCLQHEIDRLKQVGYEKNRNIQVNEGNSLSLEQIQNLEYRVMCKEAQRVCDSVEQDILRILDESDLLESELSERLGLLEGRDGFCQELVDERDGLLDLSASLGEVNSVESLK